jgi:hypothetical protein
MVAPEKLFAEARMTIFALGSTLLKQQKILSDYLEMRPTYVTVYLTVGLASIQRFVRKPDLDAAYRGVKPLPAEALGAISRRAIASATGLPRETVRRIVGDLLASGHLREAGRYGVTTRVGELVPERTQKTILALAVEITRLVDELARLGVIVPR